MSLILICLVLIDRRFGQNSNSSIEPGAHSQTSDRSRYDNQVVTVIHVVDGDTLDVDLPDGEEGQTRVRLRGVDTPETTASPGGARYYGNEAGTFTRTAILNRTVRLALDPFAETRGKYGRLLAYVYLEDGRMLNEELLTGGYGYADPRFRHIFRDRFAELQRRARRQHRGLWRDAQWEDFPAWLQKREKSP